MVRRHGLATGRSGLRSGSVADGVRGLEPPVTEKVGAEAALSGRQRPRLAARPGPSGGEGRTWGHGQTARWLPSRGLGSWELVPEP